MGAEEEDKTERKEFLEFLEKQVKRGTAQTKDSWRDYTINVIGYGNIGKNYVRGLEPLILEPDSNIKQVNVWIRNSVEDAAIEFHNDFNSLEWKDYDKIVEKVKFKRFWQIEDLTEITENAKDNSEESDMLVLFSRYNFKNIAKNLENLSKQEVVNKIRTTIKGNPKSYQDALIYLNTALKQSLDLEAIITGFQQETGINISRFNLLPGNIVGLKHLGSVLKGYQGTVVNLVNDIDITNYVFAAEADIPVNRIIGPADTDVARLKTAIKDVYFDFTGEVYKGEIESPPIYGSHGEFMAFEYTKIKFGSISFQVIFGEESENIGNLLLDKVKKYGIDFKEKNEVTSIDTIRNTLLPLTAAIVSEKPEKTFRGSIYHKEFNGFAGLNFEIKGGTVITPEVAIMESLSSECEKDFRKGTKIVQELTSLLAEKGYIQELNPRTDGLPEIPEKKEQETLVEVIIEGAKNIVKELIGNKEEKLKTKLAKSIDTEIYLPSSEQKRVILGTPLKNNLIHRALEYTVSIPREEGEYDWREREHQKMGIGEFKVSDKEIFVVAERPHGNKTMEYRIFTFDINNDSTPTYVSKPITSEDVDFRLEEMVVNNNEIYFLKKENGETTISKYNRDSNEFFDLQRVEDDIISLTPYQGKILVTSNNKVSLFDDEIMEEIYTSEENIGAVQKTSEIEKVLFYTTENGEGVVAVDLEGKFNPVSFETRYDSFDFIHIDNRGFQVATLTEEGIKVENFKNKKNLFAEKPSIYYELKDSDLQDANIWMPNKNVIMAAQEPDKLYAIFHEKGEMHMEQVEGMKEFSTFDAEVIKK
ncbi:MAG: hypothetical protein ABH828_00860 [archaeon]